MAKRIALKDYIYVDGADLSDHARSVSFSSEHAQVDVSGFSSTGTDEFLAGNTTRSLEVEFFMDNASGSTFQTLWPLHRDKSSFPIKWRKDVSASVSATNPELRGNAQILTFPQSSTRGEVETATVTFTPADSTGFYWIYT